jgi:hypothetical protein
MATVVTYEKRPDLAPIPMSNGLTSEFVSVLCLAASDLAKTDRNRTFAIWLASHDQESYGLGIVYFDVAELPWHSVSFQSDKEFMLQVIDAAKTKLGWERLFYNPREDWLFTCLGGFYQMVTSFDPQDAITEADSVWRFGKEPVKFELCPVHSIYLHDYGCIICHDEEGRKPFSALRT